MLAARLLGQGVRQAEVARQVGAHRQSVSQRAAELRQKGRVGLKKTGREGRKPLLSEPDRKRVVRGLQRGPEALAYETSLWTSARLAHLIEQECGVKYRPGHVWRILRQLGWSCQRPVRRALQRDEEKIQQGKPKRWPEVRKGQKRRSDDRLQRRKRTHRAPASLPHVGASRAHAGAAIQLQLEDAVGDCRRHRVELFLPPVSGRDRQPADHRVPFPFRRARAKLENWPETANRVLALPALLGCVGILVHSCLNFNLQIPANAALFYVLCAIAAGEPLQESQRRRRARRHHLILELRPELTERE